MERIDIITHLNEAINHITEQEEIINHLRGKIEGEKEKLKDELEVDYRKTEEEIDRYIKKYQYAPFFFTEEEMNDYHNFLYSHNSPEEDNICPFTGGFSSNIIFHYHPEEFRRGTIVVECPYCHTKRKLGSCKDMLTENDSLKNMED